jgi:hypothetical protein
MAQTKLQQALTSLKRERKKLVNPADEARLSSLNWIATSSTLTKAEQKEYDSLKKSKEKIHKKLQPFVDAVLKAEQQET